MENNFDNVDRGLVKNVNSHGCPFRSEKVYNVIEKKVKPNLRLKVSQPLRLKNHMFSEENVDTLHSHIDDVTHFVSEIQFKL